MPKYRLTDPQSGRVVTVSGDHAPTQDDAAQIFAHINQQTSQPQDPGSNVAMDAANFLAPQTTKAITQGSTDLTNRAIAREKSAKNIGDVFNNAVADTVDFGKTVFNPKLVGEVASYATPAGAESLLARLGLGATAGGLSAASQDNATPSSIAKGTVLGAGFNAVAPALGNVLNKATGKAGEKVADAGENYVLRSLRPSPSQLTKFKDETGVALDDFLAQHKITNNFTAEADNHISQLQEQFDNLAKRSGTKVDARNLLGATFSNMKDLVTSVDPADQAKVDHISEIMTNIVKKYGKKIDVADLTKERKLIDKKITDAGFTMPADQATYYRTIRDSLQDAIQEATQGKGDLKGLGQELSKWYKFQKIAKMQENLGKGSKPIGITKSAATGASAVAGSVIGGPLGAILGSLAGGTIEGIANHPKTTSLVSQGLQRTGNAMQQTQLSPMVLELLNRVARNKVASQ